MGRYDDIINLPHHVSDFHKPMPMEHRAAQFAPFAALNGHEDAIEETARETEAFKELSDYEKEIISRKLCYAMENDSVIAITYFIHDKTKAGGRYTRVYGKIKRWEETENTLLMEDGKTIPINLIAKVNIGFQRK